MSKEIEEFSSLFRLTPSSSILDLNSDFSTISNTLNNLVLSYNGSVTTVQPASIKELRVKIKRSNYDYGVICNTILDYEDQNHLMKIITLGIRDSGYIIILEDKEKPLDVIYELLEEFDFGAVNSIDIFEKYNLIIGKKLHMWGMD